MTAPPSPPTWSPDGTLLAYTAPVPDGWDHEHSAVFVMKADGTGARQVTHPFAFEKDTCEGQCDNGIDDRTVVGVGLLTTRRVDVTTDAAEGDADVELVLADGDITVPAHSARQRHPGGAVMGDPIHIQERCGIAHMDQTKDQVVQLAYTQYLLFGRTPRKLPEPECELSGDFIEFSKDLPIPPPVSTDLAAGPLTLGPAQWEGKADVIDLPGGTKVVTNDAEPVALRVAAEDLTMTVTDVDGTTRGRRVTYGPLSGDVVVKPGAADVPSVTVDGKPVAPTHDTSGGGGGGAVKPPDEVVVTATPADPPVLTATVRGGRVKLSRAGVAAIAARLRGGSDTGTVTLTAKLGRRKVRIGSARVTLPAGRTVKARVKVSKSARRAAARGGLRAVATLAMRGAAPARAAVRLTR